MTSRLLARERRRARCIAPVLLPVLVALAAGPARATAQVALEGELRQVRLDGRPVLLARLPVRNGTAFTWRVEVGRVHVQMPNDSAIVLGPVAPARVSPRVFTLAPGESQMVGVTIDVSGETAAKYRLEVTVTDGQPIRDSQAAGVRTVLTMATRYLVKLTRQAR